MAGPDQPLLPPRSDPDPGADVTRVLPTPAPGQESDDVTRVLDGAVAPGAAAAHGAAAALREGTRLAEFEITGLIGQGGFGVVYEAWDPALQRSVAIKEYLPSSLAHRLADGSVVALSGETQDTFQLGMRSFINEARLLAQFDHPSLLKVYRFWEERGTAYMAMPRYHGQTLRQALEQQAEPPPEAWLLDILDGVSQALDVMHAAQCFHRDVAPDNILLQQDSGLPVVLDFGAARRVITDQSQAVTVILKPGYAPVEQYGDLPDATQGPWTDVYALAAVAHYAVCRRVPPPSVGRMLADTYRPLADQPDLAARYSTRLLQAIDRGLAVRPADRLQSMQAFRAALGLTGAATSAPPPASTARPAAAAGRAARPRWVLGVGAALVLAAGGAWFLLAEPTAPVVEAPQVAAAPAASSVVPVAPVAPSADTDPAPSAASPPAAPIRPRSVAESLAALAAAATPGFEVKASAKKAEVQIGKDNLAFDVQSRREGYVYVLLLSSGGELFMLFPNLLDKHNRIGAGASLSLPRASWPMTAGGPAGANRFAVIVSEHERDFADTGMRQDGVFAQFPLPLLEALEAEAARKGEGTPLLGRAVCPGGAAACPDAYGVAHFQVMER